MAKPLVFFTVLIVAAATPAAEDRPAPKVTFDSSFTVECADVSPKAEKSQATEKRVIEATFRISINVDGDASTLKEVIIEIQSPDKSMKVTEIKPVAVLRSRANGPIRVSTVRTAGTDNQEKGTGGIIVASGPVVATGTLEVKDTKSTVTQVKEQYEKDAPKDATLIHTTIEREHGLRVKMKANDQEPLEGIKEITVRFEVPTYWRGDWVKVTSRAEDGTGTDGKSFGERAIAIGLFLKGEASAKSMAEYLGNVQCELDDWMTKNSGKELEAELRSKYIGALQAMKTNSK